MGLKINFERPAPPEPQEETIFDALQQLNSGKIKRTLMLVHRETGTCYKVVNYDDKTGTVNLLTSKNKKGRAVLTQREAKLYRPMWR